LLLLLLLLLMGIMTRGFAPAWCVCVWWKFLLGCGEIGLDGDVLFFACLRACVFIDVPGDVELGPDLLWQSGAVRGIFFFLTNLFILNGF
jgi:hypothetical protein